MKFKLIAIMLMAFACTACFSIEEEKNFFDKDYFSFSLNDNKDEILNKLSGKKNKVRISKEYNNRLVTISPENQILSEQINLDYSIGLFDDSVLSMSFYARDLKLFYYLQKTITLEPSINVNGKKKVYEWNFNTIKIKCWVEFSKKQATYLIYNNEVASELKKYRDSLMGDSIFE